MAKNKIKPVIKNKPKYNGKHPGGKPPWVPTEEILKEVESYGSLGMTSEQIALCLGISVGTLCNKQNEYEEFFQAIKRGKAKGIALVSSELVKNVKNKNVTAQIFYLKCQAKWREEDEAIKSEQKRLHDEFQELKKEVARCIKPV